MAVTIISFSHNGNYWESAPIACTGGDVRVRVHKLGPQPVNVLASIDGEVDYLDFDEFGGDEYKSEVTIAGVPRGQYLKLRSRARIELIKVIQT